MAETSEHPEDARLRRLVNFVACEVGVAAEVRKRAPSAGQLAALLPAKAAVPALERLALSAMLVAPLSVARLSRLRRYAQALGRDDLPTLRDLERARSGQHRRLSACLLRRFPPMRRLGAAWKRGGFGDRWRMLKALTSFPDGRTRRRYQALGELPEHTLGQAFFDHCRRNGFPLPGERRGVPETIAFHDMGHALLGAGTDIYGETTMAGFEAGTMGEHGITMLEFTLLLFNLGVRLPTAADPQSNAVDIDCLLTAYSTGKRSKIEVLTWEPWLDVHEPVATLRQRYQID
ncbi:MAG TPA: hypothetical protein ENJ18_00385 [Nannocystis exedens]|nr:hypothetical protein [Nannocystis exedens]